MIAHLREAGLVLAEKLNQRLAGGNAPAGQTRVVTGQLLAAAVVFAVIQIQDVFTARVDQVLGGLHGGELVVAHHAVHIVAMKGSIEHHHGHGAGDLTDVVVFGIIILKKGGAHEHHAVYMPVFHALRALGALGKIGTGTAEQTVVAVTAEGALKIGQRLRQIGVCRVWTKEAHRFHGVQPQTACKGIWDIAAGLDHRKHPFLGLLTHMRAVV